MKLPSHHLDALRASLKMQLELQNHVLFDDGLGGMPRHLVNDVGQIFRSIENGDFEKDNVDMIELSAHQ